MQGSLTIDPMWLIHRYDEGNDTFHLVRVDRETRRRVPFLVDRELPFVEPVVANRGDVLKYVQPSTPIHFIFHSAFCCSTLLANALDRPRIATALKEPQLLADMTGWRLRGGDPRKIQQVLHESLLLLARPFEPEETVVVKPSNVVNGLAEAILTMRPSAKAILMSAPLPVFLASIARKGMEGRLWARDLLAKQLAEGSINLGFEPRDYLLQTDLQAAAVGWLAQKAMFAHLAARFPDRVRTLDSEVIVERPRDVVRACARFFDLKANGDTVTAMVADAFNQNSKDGSAFASGQRAADHAAGEAKYAEELHKVAIWAKAVADAAHIPETAGQTLI